jgi:hypothetical protein
MASETPHLTLDAKHDDYDYPTIVPVPQSGHPGYLTPEQEAQVYQLRMKLEQDGYTERLDTLTLVRMLLIFYSPFCADEILVAISPSSEV